ncbi:cytochrome C biogenesis protein ResC [Mangrovactinospora gilvigrisea]|uniref:Cytochrome C biogenesis protein ResC n=1 Tax=Mangrovactinospora gilvigrisea TaxID=1428644 RepID=A0A1J7BK92_9ACTN|nr:cytochrome c biogenesis protein CcdA [Mangrovactinospora gilvigrisea]OIV39013.1 cytochrome C biogenesis protein ResC [Mangrovactinospora gilvigrisea]
MGNVGHTITSGALLAAAPIALLAGLVSFFSPCVLPLVPGYLSYVTGSVGVDLKEQKRGRIAIGALLFVLGFTAVFVSTGALFGYFGSTLQEYRTTLNIVFGSVTILLGLSFMGVLGGVLGRFTQREARFHYRPEMGWVGAPILGVLFGVGWTPCIGPTLSAVTSLSIDQASALRGAFLTAVYCLGLGLPFLLAALAFRRALGAFGFVRRHYQWVMRIGGGMLVLVGLALVTGAWSSLVNQLQYWTSNYSIGL